MLIHLINHFLAFQRGLFAYDGLKKKIVDSYVFSILLHFVSLFCTSYFFIFIDVLKKNESHTKKFSIRNNFSLIKWNDSRVEKKKEIKKERERERESERERERRHLKRTRPKIELHLQSHYHSFYTFNSLFMSSLSYLVEDKNARGYSHITVCIWIWQKWYFSLLT